MRRLLTIGGLLLLLAVLLLLIDARYIGLRQRLFSPLAKLPPGVADGLHDAREMTLYSLDPYHFGESASDTPSFHGFLILGETRIASAESRRLVADTVQQGIAHWNGRVMSCFNPRHGLRVSDGRRTYDLVICFECQKIANFAGDQRLGPTGITGQQAALDDILKTAQIPLPKSD